MSDVRNYAVKLGIKKANEVFEKYSLEKLESILEFYRLGFSYKDISEICDFKNILNVRSEKVLVNIIYKMIHGTEENTGLIYRSYDPNSEIYSYEFVKEFVNPENEIEFLRKMHYISKNNGLKKEGKGIYGLEKSYSKEELKKIRSEAGKKGGYTALKEEKGLYTKDSEKRKEMLRKSLETRGHINWNLPEEGYEEGKVCYLPLIQYAYMLSLQEEYRTKTGTQVNIKKLAERLNEEIFKEENVVKRDSLKYQLSKYRKNIRKR